jgi:lauroyl/myristoyl acyltransferase
MCYTAMREQLRNYYITDLLLEDNEYLQGQLQLVSAGLMHYLPELPFKSHEAIYREILFCKQLSVWEQTQTEALKYLNLAGEYVKALTLLNSGPCIICTMHTGSYRLLNLYLIQQAIPFSLVTGKEVMQKEGDVFQQIFQETNRADRLRLIDAESSTAGLQMLRELKAGRSLVLYIDGHTGSGAATSVNSNRCEVDFLGQQLYVRKGIAHLAHAAGVPILPVGCYCVSPGDVRLHFYEAFFPAKHLSRELFASETTQQLYNVFGELIRLYPGQWEGWLTLHKTAKIVRRIGKKRRLKKGEKIILDELQFGIFKWEGVPYLLQKQQYQFYEIDEMVYQVLQACKTEPIEISSVDAKLLTDLIAKAVVVFV